MEGIKSPSMSPVVYSNGGVDMSNATKEELNWMDAYNGGDHYICVEYEGTLVKENGEFNANMKDRVANWLRGKLNVVVAVNRGTDKKVVVEKLKREFGRELPVINGFSSNMIEFWSSRAFKPSL